MRIGLMILICLATSGTIHSQSTYMVIKVNGQIEYVDKGTDMACGDEFSEEVDLSFKNQNSWAVVINPEKGRFLLTAETQNQLANSSFLPARSDLNTLGGKVVSLKDLEKQFSGQIAIIDSASLSINPLYFPMRGSLFFYLQCQYNEELINKKLAPNGSFLTLRKKEILKVDGKPISGFTTPEVSLNYYKKEGPQFISKFKLIFPDHALLKDELSIILEAFPEYGYSQQVDEVSAYLHEFYGKTNREDIMGFLDEALGISQ